MVSRGLVRIKGASTKDEKPPNTPNALPHPTILISPAVSRRKTVSERSLTNDPGPLKKVSVIDQALKLIHPRTSRLSNSKLKIAPSGAIVFTPAQSQESLGSSILPVERTAVPLATPVQDLHIPDIAGSRRSSSFESVRSSQSNVPRARTTEYEKQQRYNFLGRHPPPIQRRSASLSRILEHPSRLRSSPRQALFFGGPNNRPRPGYIKVPRFVPLEIRQNPSVAMANAPDCVHCNDDQTAERCDVAPCNHSGQRFSLYSSRSTRGSSEVPILKIYPLHERGAFPVFDSKGVIKSVGNRFKAVFSKGKENGEHETEEPAS